MMKPDEVEAMLGLHELGWGTRRIAREFGCSRNTVKRYVEARGWVAYGGPRRNGKLAGLDAWLEERFFRHRGNAEVVRQDLANEQSIEVSLRTVERAVAPYRRRLAAEAKATLRFETPPGRQLQIDFGTSRVPIGGETMRVHLFVATPGYSRRTYVQAFAHERQSAWFAGIEGGVPALRRCHGRGPGGQPEGAGGARRRGDARAQVQPPDPPRAAVRPAAPRHRSVLILGTLKLLGHVDWSWTWVLAPAALSIAVTSLTSAVVYLRHWHEWCPQRNPSPDASGGEPP